MGAAPPPFCPSLSVSHLLFISCCRASLSNRLRFPWYDYHNKFLFADAGGEAVWGNLESFLAVRTKK